MIKESPGSDVERTSGSSVSGLGNIAPSDNANVVMVTVTTTVSMITTGIMTAVKPMIDPFNNAKTTASTENSPQKKYHFERKTPRSGSGELSTIHPAFFSSENDGNAKR